MLRGLSPVPTLYRGFPLHPDDDKDPYVFRIDRSGFAAEYDTARADAELGAGTRAVHLDLVPMSLQKRPATSNPRLWLNGALAVAATAIAVRRRRARPRRSAS